MERSAIGERDMEPRLAALGRRHFDVAELDGLVRPQLIASDLQELPRRDAVARQESVHGLRGGVARLARVAHEHAPPAAAEHQRGAQPGGTASRR